MKKVDPKELVIDETGIWFVNENKGIKIERIKEIKILELKQGKIRNTIIFFAVVFTFISTFVSIWFLPIAVVLLYILFFPKKVIRIYLNDGGFLDLTSDDFDTLKKLFQPLNKTEKPLVELQDALRKRLSFFQLRR